MGLIRVIWDGKGMYIRLAEKRDCLDLWKWRNDYKAVMNSISRSVVPYQSHSKWFNRLINETDAEIFIAYDKKEKNKIGMVRFERKLRKVSEVSININPHFRGKGLGREFLSRSIATFFKSKPGFVVKARVLIKNHRSKRLFKSCGFGVSSVRDKIVHYTLKGGSNGDK